MAGLFGSFDLSFSATPYSTDQYVFEIREGDGTLIWFMRDLREARMDQYLTAPAMLEISMSLENGARQHLDNYIWVRRNGDDDGVYVGVFSVAEYEEDPDAGIYRAICYDSLFQLARERVREYHATATIAEHVAAWLALQEFGTPLTIGNIDSAIGALERTVDITDSNTILASIYNLDDTIRNPSHIYVVGNALHWETIDTAAENQLLVGRHNLKVIKSVRNDTVVTRLYAYGTNLGGRRVRMSDISPSYSDYVGAEDDWVYRRQLVFNHLQVGGDGLTQSGYVHTLDLAGQSHITTYAKPDGTDIYLHTTSGAKVNHTLVTAGGVLTGIMFKPTLSTVVDTVIYMYYGDWDASGGAKPGDYFDWFVPGSLTGGVLETYNNRATVMTIGTPKRNSGIAPGEMVADHISDPEELRRWATERLVEMDSPAVSYQVNITDIEALKRFPIHSYSLAKYQHIVDVDRGWDTSEVVVRISRNLLNPSDCTMELGRLTERDGAILTDLIEAREVDDKTGYLDAENVRIGPAGGTTLRDWEREDEPGYIDGEKVKGLPVHGHHIGRITSGEISGGKHSYTVEIWKSDGSGPEVPAATETGCIVPDNSIDQIGESAMVWVYSPLAEDRDAGAKPVVVAVAASGGNSASVARHSHSGMSDGGNVAGFCGLY